MTHVTEAVYTKGVLKPVNALKLREQQRVRLIVQSIDGSSTTDRSEALERLRRGIDGMDFRSAGRLPSRDELHDRP